MTRDQATLRQDVVSSDPKDAASPYGYIFAFRPNGTHARVVFADDSMRDVPLSALNAANAVPSPVMTESRDYHWTRHTFRCEDCGKLCRASAESLASHRATDPDGYVDVTDAQLASDFSLCLSCFYSDDIAGEHITA
jgi:hypothetical protein